MAVSLRSLAPNSRINFLISAQIEGKTRYSNFAFLGEVSYTIASSMKVDLSTLVAASAAYFRDGSSKNATQITYIVVRQTESSAPIVIPEPLLQLNSLELAGNEVHTAIVRGVSADQLRSILTGNNVTDFSITTTQV